GGQRDGRTTRVPACDRRGEEAHAARPQVRGAVTRVGRAQARFQQRTRRPRSRRQGRRGAPQRTAKADPRTDRRRLARSGDSARAEYHRGARQRREVQGDQEAPARVRGRVTPTVRTKSPKANGSALPPRLLLVARQTRANPNKPPS